MHLPLRGPAAIGIVGLTGVLLAPAVQQGVGGAAIEPERRLAGREDAEVGNATQIQHHQRLAGVIPHGLMKHRHQRRALPACRHIAATEVAGHGNAGQLRQQRAVDELRGVAGAIEQARAVAHGLAVCADDGHGLRRYGSLSAELLHALCIHAHQRIGSQGATMQFIVAGGIERQQFVPQHHWQIDTGKAALAQRQSPARCGADVDQNAIDTIHGGAGHEADAGQGQGSGRRSHARIIRQPLW